MYWYWGNLALILKGPKREQTRPEVALFHCDLHHASLARAASQSLLHKQQHALTQCQAAINAACQAPCQVHMAVHMQTDTDEEFAWALPCDLLSQSCCAANLLAGSASVDSG